MAVYNICDTRVNCNIVEQMKYDLDARDVSYYLLLDFLWKDTFICNKIIEVENKVSNSLQVLKGLKSRCIGESESDIYDYLVDSIDRTGEVSRELATKQYNVTHVKDLLFEAKNIIVDSWLTYDSQACVGAVCRPSFNSRFKTICDIREANSDSLVEFFISPFRGACDNENNRPFNIIQAVDNSLSEAIELLGKIEGYACDKELLAVN